MKIKALLVASILTPIFCATTVFAMTDTEKQTLISQIQQQILVLQQQMAQILSQQQETANWCHTFSNYLKVGDNGNEIQALQVALGKEKLLIIGSQSAADSAFYNFGDATLNAVKAFQKKYGISQTGTVGPLTRTKLNTLYGCVQSQQSSSMPPYNPDTTNQANNQTSNQSSAVCLSDSGCAFGYICVNHACQKMENFCSSDKDCAVGKCKKYQCNYCDTSADCPFAKEYACNQYFGETSKTCKRNLCSIDANCDTGRVCLKNTGQCVPATTITEPINNSVCNSFPGEEGCAAITNNDPKKSCESYCTQQGKYIDSIIYSNYATGIFLSDGGYAKKCSENGITSGVCCKCSLTKKCTTDGDDANSLSDCCAGLIYENGKCKNPSQWTLFPSSGSLSKTCTELCQTKSLSCVSSNGIDSYGSKALYCGDYPHIASTSTSLGCATKVGVVDTYCCCTPSAASVGQASVQVDPVPVSTNINCIGINENYAGKTLPCCYGLVKNDGTCKKSTTSSTSTTGCLANGKEGVYYSKCCSGLYLTDTGRTKIMNGDVIFKIYACKPASIGVNCAGDGQKMSASVGSVVGKPCCSGLQVINSKCTVPVCTAGTGAVCTGSTTSLLEILSNPIGSILDSIKNLLFK